MFLMRVCLLLLVSLLAFATPTNVKMMAMVEDPPNPLHAAREPDLRVLFVSYLYNVMFYS